MHTILQGALVFSCSVSYSHPRLYKASMKHSVFEIKDNHRLALRHIDFIRMTPQQRVQLILGSNGSGKTSILREMSLFPANHKDYKRGGYKKNIVEFRGKTYELLSDFRGLKNIYSIKEDGETLVEGPTAVVFQNKVREIFGITPEIHRLMIGAMRFCEMDVSELRSWFTKLSPMDYSYAIAYHKRLADTHRDTQGTINRLSNKLLSDKARLISDTEEVQLTQEIAALRLRKQEMMQHWAPIKTTVTEALDAVDLVDVQLTSITNRYTQSLRVFANHEGYKDLAEVRTLAATVQGEIAYLTKSNDDIYETVESNRKTLQEAVSAVDQDVKTIDGVILELRRQSAQIKDSLFFKDDPMPSLEAADAAMQDCLPGMQTVIFALRADPEDKITLANLTIMREKREEIVNRISWLERESQKQEQIMQTMEHHHAQDQIECPKCTHRWSHGYDQKKHAEAKEQFSKANAERAALIKSREALDEEIRFYAEEIERYQFVVNQIRPHARTFAPVWNQVVLTKLFKKIPQQALRIIEAVPSELHRMEQIQALDKEIARQTDLRELAERTSHVDQQSLTHTNTQLQTKLLHQQRQVRDLQQRKKRLELVEEAMQFQIVFPEQTTSLISQREQHIRDAEDANHRSVINKILVSLDAEILSKERAINQIEVQKGIVAGLEKEIKDCGDRERLLKIAMDELSPTRGLIAKGLTGFINHFIAQMNAIIKEVWLYPMELLPIRVTEDEGVKLDYRFRFLVDNRLEVPDVQEASGGQQEIFNLAFMLVSMTHLGLEDFPIFLDEFSIKMDYSHRKEVLRMIINLLSSSNFSQIFMISHYENSYGNLADADITVICPENVELPADLQYNQNTQFSKGAVEDE